MVSSGFQIRNYKFDVPNRRVEGLEDHLLSRDWPVVYLIHNTEELYVGETSSAINRMYQHLDNRERKKLNQVKIIFDAEYNKSAILDIEQSLIHLYSVDGMFRLQNRNGGQSKKHNYYQREKYLNKVDEIWSQLHTMQMTKRSILDIKNSDSYKYSPYNSLTDEQHNVCIQTINDILDNLLNDKQGITIIQGSAGTGKSVVMMNMIFQMVNACSIQVDFSEDDENLTDYQQIQHKVTEYLRRKNKRELKVAYVIAMTSFRATVKKVFTLTQNGLKGAMVIGPTDIKKADVEDKYDVVFVDEAHRLARRKNISYMGSFDNKCRELFGQDCDVTEYTQLDWIIAGSKNVVMVYDQDQRVAGSDITHEQFLHSIEGIDSKTRQLKTQMRCVGGTEFEHYIKDILCCQCGAKKAIKDYDFELYTSIERLVNDIMVKEQEHKLCRVVAGYAWEWKSKGCADAETVVREGKEDIEIEGHKYIWNMTNSAWILNENAINEIGCIHTTQGYDLNYVGIILGREIDYDPVEKTIVINKDLFFDKKAKNGTTPEQLKNYIINAYSTMMLRGIKGCFVYAYNENLRNYLKGFIHVKEVEQEVIPKWKLRLMEQQRTLFDETRESEVTIVDINDIKDMTDINSRYVPYFDFKMACGAFESGESVLSCTERGSEKGWISAEDIGRKVNKNMFVVQAKGNSMLNKIHPSDLCLFELYTNENAGSRNNDIVLAKQPQKDNDYDYNFTIKEYHSEKIVNADGTWQHLAIELRPLNPEYETIKLSAEDDVSVIARFVKVL